MPCAVSNENELLFRYRSKHLDLRVYEFEVMFLLFLKLKKSKVESHFDTSIYL